MPPRHRHAVLRVDTAAVLVHDLKCPLSALTMNLEYALSELPAEASCDDVREALRDCRAAGVRLFRMVTNLLDVARADAGRLAPRLSSVSVGALLEAAVKEGAEEARARGVALDHNGYDGEFDLDPDLLSRVVDSLVEVALAAAPPGGRITLSAALDGGALELRVPTGADVPRDARAALFGSGGEHDASGAASPAVPRALGLFFCRAAVEAHGGTIAIVDDPPSAPTAPSANAGEAVIARGAGPDLRGATTSFRILLPRRTEVAELSSR